MRAFIKRNIQGNQVLLLFIVTNIVYVYMLLVTIPNVMSYSDGMKILDMMPGGYNPDYVVSLFSTLGEQGRNEYLFHQIPVDFVYPLLFAISSFLVLAYFLHQLKKLKGVLFYLCFIPLFAGFFDYCENIGIISLLTNFPENSYFMMRLTSVFSILKSFFTVCYFSILIILLIAFGLKKLVKKTG